MKLFHDHEFILELHPLSDMDNIERGYYERLKRPAADGVHMVIVYVDTPESFAYLLSKGFDVFGLLEKGLAIYKTEKI